MRKAKDSDLRILFERQYGRRVSDSTWYRTKKVFNNDFPLTEQNLIWLADIKKQLPQCETRLACFVANIKKIQEQISKSRDSISGSDFLEFLREKGIEVHVNTRTKWFKPINGFRKSRVYTSQELKPVILAAFTYKLRKDNAQTLEALTTIH